MNERRNKQTTTKINNQAINQSIKRLSKQTNIQKQQSKQTTIKQRQHIMNANIDAKFLLKLLYIYN